MSEFDLPQRLIYRRAVAVLAVLGVLMWHVSADASAGDLMAQTATGPDMVSTTPTATPVDVPSVVTPSEGVPAIVPSLGDTPPDVPAITMADIEAYYYPLEHGFGIESVEFVVGPVVEARLDRAPRELGNRLLAVVTLYGEFSVPRPPELNWLPPADRMSVAFDAHTGNELAFWYP